MTPYLQVKGQVKGVRTKFDTFLNLSTGSLRVDHACPEIIYMSNFADPLDSNSHGNQNFWFLSDIQAKVPKSRTNFE